MFDKCDFSNLVKLDDFDHFEDFGREAVTKDGRRFCTTVGTHYTSDGAHEPVLCRLPKWPGSPTAAVGAHERSVPLFKVLS